MLNKKQASKVSPLVANKEAWDSLEEYLREQIQMTLRALVAAQSELEVFRLQGRITSLEQIKGLKADYDAAVRAKE
jgi:hypothetical protein|tara:strand:+ start:128 stop:355 length:228 start_codon:yes stop_codon:yes gene_type:complete